MRRFAAVLAALALLFSIGAPLASANDAGDNYNLYAARSYWQRASDPCPNPQIIHYWPWGAGHSDYASCQIWVNGLAYTSWPAGRACMIVMHEMGHLYGLGDNYDNPSDVMYYATDPWNNIPYVRWPCAW